MSHGSTSEDENKGHTFSTRRGTPLDSVTFGALDDVTFLRFTNLARLLGVLKGIFT
jgi:hypothetical protein